MRVTLYFSSITVCILISFSCFNNAVNENLESTDIKSTNKPVDSLAAISKIVDYFNYNISKYALKNDTATYRHFDGSLKDSKKSIEKPTIPRVPELPHPQETKRELATATSRNQSPRTLELGNQKA